MNRLRLALGGLGVLGLVYAGWLVVGSLGPDSVRLALWLAGVVIVHDGLLVPLVLAIAWVGRRLLPRSAWGLAAAGFVAAGTLIALSGIVLLRSGRDSTLTSLLDRNYPLGLAAALGLVLIVTGGIHAARTWRGSRALQPAGPAGPRTGTG